MVQHSMPLNGVQITWLGHATFKFTTPEGKILLIDPWTYHNPACPDEYKHIEKVHLLLATHGQASLEELALAYLRETRAPEVTR